MRGVHAFGVGLVVSGVLGARLRPMKRSSDSASMLRSDTQPHPLAMARIMASVSTTCRSVRPSLLLDALNACRCRSIAAAACLSSSVPPSGLTSPARSSADRSIHLRMMRSASALLVVRVERSTRIPLALYHDAIHDPPGVRCVREPAPLPLRVRLVAMFTFSLRRDDLNRGG